MVRLCKGGLVWLVVLVCGCGSLDPYKLPDSVGSASYGVSGGFISSGSDRLISGSFSDYPLSELWRIMPNDVSYAYDKELADACFSLECKDLALDDFLMLVSRQMGVDYMRDRGIYYLGKIDMKSFSVFVGRVGALDSERVNKIVDVVKTADGRASMLDGGLLVFSDRWVAVQRLNSVLQQIHDDVRNFAVNVWLVNDARVRELYAKGGIDGRYLFDWSAGSVASSSNWSAVVSALADFSADMSDSRDVRRFSCLVRDGEGFTYNNGLSVPVLKKTVSDSGTVTTSGVEYVDVGTKLDIKLMRRDDSSCLAMVRTEVSSNEREIEGYPVKNSSVYSSVFSLRFGDVVIVGRYEVDQDGRGLFGLKKSSTSYWMAFQVNVE